MAENDEARDLAVMVAQAAERRGAMDAIILDVRELMAICDYFVICTGRARAHIRAVADAVEERLKEEQWRVWHREGQRDATWSVLDYGAVVAHIFSEEGREFYDLERLWSDAPRVPFESLAVASPASAIEPEA